MLKAKWKTAFASSTGTSHEKTGVPCQDASGCRVLEAADGTEILLVVVSDGAGTAPRSDVGACMVVTSFLERFASFCFQNAVAAIDADVVTGWFQAVKEEIRRQAEADSRSVNDYACTILGAVVGQTSSAYIQLGDGAIVVKADDDSGCDYSWVFWPQHGEYANSTYFVTQEGVESLLQFETGPAVDEIALFTDGIERLVLDMARKTVHGPAFRPVFDWLATTAPNRGGQPSGVIQAYLDSDHINRRTDDDKSLVMATRMVVQPPEESVCDSVDAPP
ncbi:PP2C family serine/threonine-protein phosphatase [Gluconacetobacter sacchari]|uniref:PP2C family serine/threonine-protein phosphatase n=1 Tax=Gluconacetobacter sacchari TaxID=92759 RepID=UPI0039B3DFB3